MCIPPLSRQVRIGELIIGAKGIVLTSTRDKGSLRTSTFSQRDLSNSTSPVPYSPDSGDKSVVCPNSSVDRETDRNDNFVRPKYPDVCRQSRTQAGPP